MGVASMPINPASGITSGLSGLQVKTKQAVTDIASELRDTANNIIGSTTDGTERAYNPDPTPPHTGRVAKYGGMAVNALASMFPAGRAAKLVYQNRKWITYVLIWVAFMFISGFMNIAENIKNDPVGFALSKGICLYVEGKSALECVGCQDLENKYGADPVKFGCEAVVNASKGNQVAEN